MAKAAPDSPSGAAFFATVFCACERHARACLRADRRESGMPARRKAGVRRRFVLLARGRCAGADGRQRQRQIELVAACRRLARSGGRPSVVGRGAGRGRHRRAPFPPPLCRPSGRGEADHDAARNPELLGDAAWSSTRGPRHRLSRTLWPPSGSMQWPTGRAGGCPPGCGGAWRSRACWWSPPTLWLLDEPTSALDDDSQARLERAIAAHRAAGGRVLLATHAAIALDDAEILELDAFAPRFDPDLGA